MTPEDIEVLFQGSAQRDASDNGGEGPISFDESAARLRKLGEVFLASRLAWFSNSDTLDRIAEKLGDGSRDGEFNPPSPPSFVL